MGAEVDAARADLEAHHDLSDEVAGAWKPWPPEHKPATPGERRMWRAFATVRDDEGARLTPRAVARRAGMSPTPIAFENGAYGVLRTAIVTEMDRRKPAPKPEARPTKEEVDRAQQEHRETRITYWRSMAQEADSRNLEFEVRALRAEAKAAKATAIMRRLLDDLKAGRWVVRDPDALTMADLMAVLGPARRGGRASDADTDGEDLDSDDRAGDGFDAGDD